MKFAARALVLGICAAGASAAVLTSHATTMMVSHQAAAATPVPTCGPHDCTNGNLTPVPTCGPHDCTDGN